MSYPKHMADLYRRLKQIGFERKYVQSVLLPDWWDDSLAQETSNRRIAEMHIARALRIPPSQLADPEAALSLATHQPLFKKWRGVQAENLGPAVAIAARAAQLVVTAMPAGPTFSEYEIDPLALRAQLLAANDYITLSCLLDWCWNSGLPVLHIPNLPSKARRADGMVLSAKGKPVVVLSSNRKASPWFIWYLSHEIGHIAKGHLEDGEVLDEHINSSSEPKEIEANRFAQNLIYGPDGSTFHSKKRIRAQTLAAEARRLGSKRTIFPGSVAVAYANTMAGNGTPCWPAAANALTLLRQDSGGPETIQEKLAARIDLDELAEADRTFLTALCNIPD